MALGLGLRLGLTRPAVAAAGGGGGVGTFADIWSDAEIIGEPVSDNITTDTGVSVLTLTGSAGGSMRQGTAGSQPTYNATDANFNGRPSMTFDGTDDFLAGRNTANDADLLLSDGIANNLGYMIVACRPGAAAGGSQAVLLMDSFGAIGLLWLTGIGGDLRAQGYDTATRNVIIGGGDGVTCVVAWRKDGTKVYGSINGGSEVEVNCNNLSAFFLGSQVCLGGWSSGDDFNGEVAGFAMGKTVPGDFADRITETMTLFGIS